MANDGRDEFTAYRGEADGACTASGAPVHIMSNDEKPR